LFLILREEHILRVFKNRVLKRIFELKGDEVMEGGKNYIMRSCMIYTLRQCNYNYQVEEEEVVGECNANGEKRNKYELFV
jgi:hypothetical protein